MQNVITEIRFTSEDNSKVTICRNLNLNCVNEKQSHLHLISVSFSLVKVLDIRNIENPNWYNKSI